MHLSPKAWDILAELAIHAGKVVTHRHLLTKVWGRASETEQQYLRVYIRQLRQKLEADPDQPQLHRHRAGGRLSAHGRGLSASRSSASRVPMKFWPRSPDRASSIIARHRLSSMP